MFTISKEQLYHLRYIIGELEVYYHQDEQSDHDDGFQSMIDWAKELTTPSI